MKSSIEYLSPQAVHDRLAGQRASLQELRQSLMAQHQRLFAYRRDMARPAFVQPYETTADIKSGLPRRLGQTLDRLLHGDSEKQVAVRLGISRHTVHNYVTALYRHFNVTTRAELLLRCMTGNDKLPQ